MLRDESHQSIVQRLRTVWYWFLPAWLLPVMFLCLVPIGRVLGPKVAIVLMFALVPISGVAIKAKRVFNWGEFYLLSAGIPAIVLTVGFAIVLIYAFLQ